MDALVELKRKKKECIMDPVGTAPSEPTIEDAIKKLKEENEELRKKKTFYRKGDRVRIYNKYLATKQDKE